MSDAIRCVYCNLPMFSDRLTRHCRFCTWVMCLGCQVWFDSRKAEKLTDD
jgi:hypothetical protein